MWLLSGACLPQPCHMSPILTQRQRRTSCHNKRSRRGRRRGRGGRVEFVSGRYQQPTPTRHLYSLVVLHDKEIKQIHHTCSFTKHLRKCFFPLMGFWYDLIERTHFVGEYMWFLWWFSKGFRWPDNRGVISETTLAFWWKYKWALPPANTNVDNVGNASLVWVTTTVLLWGGEEI